MSNFYEDKILITERVKLAEDITLPESIDDYKNIENASNVKIVTCDVYAFVDATAISGPACVYIE